MNKRKTRIIKIIIVFILCILIQNSCYAVQEEILEEQSKALNINQFTTKADEYTKDVFNGIDAKDLLNSAIKGEIDNKTIISKILNLFGNEIRQTLHILRRYSSNYCST